MEGMCKCAHYEPYKPITITEHFRKNARLILGRSCVAMIICALILLTSCISDTSRIPIEKATIEQLDACKNIGTELAIDIYKYVHSPKWDGDIKELDKIKGIGPERMNSIIKAFR